MSATWELKTALCVFAGKSISSISYCAGSEYGLARDMRSFSQEADSSESRLLVHLTQYQTWSSNSSRDRDSSIMRRLLHCLID
jgi:hypothetical protein